MRRAVLFCSVFLPAAALAQGFGAPPPIAASPPPVVAPLAPSTPGSGLPVPSLGGGSGQWVGRSAAQAAGPGQPAYGGCYGCSYAGDYIGSNVSRRGPAPPLRLQGQWRNGWWYY